MKNLKLIVLVVCLSAATLSSADYSNKPQVTDFIDLMVNKHQFERQQVLDWLAAAEQQTSIINAMSRPAEKVKPWHEYRKLFVSDLRIKRGVEFWQQHEATLERAYEQYGVDPAIIVSILGVETNYGRNTGSYRVIDALSTLAFDYYHSIEQRESRKKFFTIQLENLFCLLVSKRKTHLALMGPMPALWVGGNLCQIVIAIMPLILTKITLLISGTIQQMRLAVLPTSFLKRVNGKRSTCGNQSPY